MKTLSLIILLLITSCSDNKFRNVEELNGFRILAIVADNPEVGPGGGNVNLQLYVSDTKGGGRSITGTTVSCIDPGISSGASVGCDHDPTRQTGSYTIDTTVGDPAGNLFTGLNSDIAVVVVPPQLLTGRSEREKFNGVGYITIFTFNVDGKDVSAFKRVSMTNRGSQNFNPASSSLELNGSAFGGTPEKGDRLRVISSDQETYQFRNIENATETVREKYQVAFYASSGELDRPKADVAEESKFIKELSTSQFVIVAIIRDERGGVEVIRVP